MTNALTTPTADGPRPGARPPHLLRDALLGLWSSELPVPEQGWDLCNETPWPIWVHRPGVGVFTLSPLERRTVRDPHPPRAGTTARERSRQGFPEVPGPVAAFELERLVERRQLSVRPLVPEAATAGALAQVLRAAAVVAFLWALSVAVLPRPLWVGLGVGLAAVLLVVVFLLLTRPGRLSEARLVQRWTFQGLTMVVVLLVAVVAPALALWTSTPLHDQVRLTRDLPWVHVVRATDFVPRILQLVLIATASLLPALMFFQFDAERLSTLRDRWLHTIFRFDPTLATVADVEAKYGRQLEEAYGTPSDGRGRLTRGRRSPLIVATVLLTFGWLLVLLNTEPTVVDGALDPVSLVTPNPTTVTYAFLGAYFFALNVVYNAYVRNDLRPKTYNQLTVRVLLALVLAWLIDLAAGDGSLPVPWLAYGLAFAAGIVPRTVLHWFGEKLDGGLSTHGRKGPRRFAGLADVIASGEQLTRLDGIDLYERTRLSDEGITTLQALAHHDLVDLFFRTRTSPVRLVDWVDQAVLQLYLDQVRGADRAPDATAVAALRRMGVRTATDFIRAVGDEQGRASVAAALGDRCADPDRSRACVELLELTLSASEWAARIARWRTSDLVAVDPMCRRYLDGDGTVQRGDPRCSVPGTPGAQPGAPPAPPIPGQIRLPQDAPADGSRA